PALDLTAYRRRAEEMLEALRTAGSASKADRLHALGVFAVQLAALIEDLRSTGADATVLDPLVALQGELQTLVTADGPGDAAVAATWARAEQVLGAFVGSGQAASGPG